MLRLSESLHLLLTTSVQSIEETPPVHTKQPWHYRHNSLFSWKQPDEGMVVSEDWIQAEEKRGEHELQTVHTNRPGWLKALKTDFITTKSDFLTANTWNYEQNNREASRYISFLVLYTLKSYNWSISFFIRLLRFLSFLMGIKHFAPPGRGTAALSRRNRCFEWRWSNHDACSMYFVTCRCSCYTNCGGDCWGVTNETL